MSKLNYWIMTIYMRQVIIQYEFYICMLLSLIAQYTKNRYSVQSRTLHMKINFVKSVEIMPSVVTDVVLMRRKILMLSNNYSFDRGILSEDR